MSRRRALKRIILQLDDAPDRVAASFGLGVFIAFFPLIGIHILMALALTVALRLNRLAVLAGIFVCNPWTIAPMFAAGTLVGCAVLGVSPNSLAGIDWSLSGRAFHESVLAGLGPLVLPFAVGNLVLGAVAGVASFLMLRAVLARRRQPTTGARARGGSSSAEKRPRGGRAWPRRTGVR
jgi:hypothetical protein